MTALNSTVSGPIVGRQIERIESVELADGVVRELRSVSGTFQDANGVWRTYEHVTITPPLNCNCAVKDLHDVTLCHLCRAVVCVSKHSFQCPACGRTACTSCRTQMTVEEQSIAVCVECKREATTPKVLKILRKAIWG